MVLCVYTHLGSVARCLFILGRTGPTIYEFGHVFFLVFVFFFVFAFFPSSLRLGEMVVDAYTLSNPNQVHEDVILKATDACYMGQFSFSTMMGD